MAEKVNMVVLGVEEVGKTALTTQVSPKSDWTIFLANEESLKLCLNYFPDTYDPTIEDSFRKKVQVDGRPYLLDVTDTGGLDEYSGLRDQWIQDGHVFVLVYSIASRHSFQQIKTLHEQIRLVKEADNYNAMQGELHGSVPVTLVGNKCDCVTEREVAMMEGSTLAKTLGCNFVETSAKNCINVEEAFFDLIRQLPQRKADAAALMHARTIRNAKLVGDGKRVQAGFHKQDKVSGQRAQQRRECVIL